MLSLNAPPLLIFLYYKCIKWQTIITQLWSSPQFYGAFGVFQLFGLVVQPATFKILFSVTVLINLYPATQAAVP